MDKNVIRCGIGWKKLYEPILKMIFDFDDKQKSPLDKIGVKCIECIDGKMYIKLENYENLTTEIDIAIDNACKESLKVCELCGETHNVGTTMNFDYVTCCKDCWEKKIMSKNSESIWKEYSTGKCYRKIKNDNV